MEEIARNLSLAQILLIIMSGMFLYIFYLRRSNESLRVRVMKLQHDLELDPLLKDRAEADARLKRVEEEFDANLKSYRSKYPVDSGPDGGQGGSPQ